MTELKIVICDDEQLAVERLGRMLRGLPDVELVRSFLSGEELLTEFDGGADIILLDVEMPKVDGFDVAEALSRRHWPDDGGAPLLILVTAHSEFAVDAFDSGAIDFLTKPVRLTRLERALERARAAVEARQAHRRLAEVAVQLDRLKQLHPDRGDEPHLWVRRGSQLIRLNVSEIDWIAAEGECARFHSGTDSYLERLSISAVAAQFGQFVFVRIHRSAVVNADRIESLTRTRWGSLQLLLRTGTELRVSKSFQPGVRELLQRKAPSRIST